MTIKPLRIGLTGVAGAGKDLFHKLLAEKLAAKYGINLLRFALADELKEELKQWCAAKYALDTTSTDRVVKEKLRDLLVFHGNIMRDLTEGRYWINKLNDKMAPFKDQSFCITDIRFTEYSNDENYWIKRELGGLLVHIEKYQIVDGKKTTTQPRNQFEAKYNTPLKAQSDFRVCWEEISGEDVQTRDERLGAHVDSFIAALVYQDKLPKI